MSNDDNENLLDTLRRVDELPAYLKEINRLAVIEKWRSNPLVAKVLEGNASVADAIAELAAANAGVRFFGSQSYNDRLGFNWKAEEASSTLSSILPPDLLNALGKTPTDFWKAAFKSFLVIFGGLMLIFLSVTTIEFKMMNWPILTHELKALFVIFPVMCFSIWLLTFLSARAQEVTGKHEKSREALGAAEFLDGMLKRQTA